MVASVIRSFLQRRRQVSAVLCCILFLAAGCAAATDFIDFATLTRSTTPNDALACPADFCRAKADFVTAPVPIPATALAAKVLAVLAEEPRTELVARNDTGLKFVFVQRSRIFRFPDTVNIAIIPSGDETSGLAIYSRSNYGHGDFGVNHARVSDWLAKLGVSVSGNGAGQ
jgi:uncharacterized protein (DUF1499 family)